MTDKKIWETAEQVFLEYCISGIIINWFMYCLRFISFILKIFDCSVFAII